MTSPERRDRSEPTARAKRQKRQGTSSQEDEDYRRDANYAREREDYEQGQQRGWVKEERGPRRR